MFLLSWCETAAQWGLDFVYPRCCLLCRCLLPEKAKRDEKFCFRCLAAIAPEIPYRCRRCSAPVGPHLNTDRGCLHCNRYKHQYHQVVSLGPYQNELRRACLRAKQHGQRALAAALAGLMCRRHQTLLQEWKCDFIIPVPHHWRDRLHVEHATMAISEALSRTLKIPVRFQSLHKIRRTRRQQELPASVRESNLKGAFRVGRTRDVSGKRILLTDDILTTGITADRCARALLDAGAARVNVAVLARSIGG